MELVVIAVLVVLVGWIFRKSFKVWAERAEEISLVTSKEVEVSNAEREAKLASKITDQLLVDCELVDSRLALLRARKSLPSE